MNIYKVFIGFVCFSSSRSCGTFFLITILINGAFAQNTWTQKKDFGGGPRVDAVGFSIGTKAYIGTGIDSGANYKKDFWQWDQITDTWTQLADFGGSPRCVAVGFSIGTRGYIGTGFDGHHDYTDFWQWDQVTNVWTRKTNFEGGPRRASVGFSIGNTGYIGTGYDSAFALYGDFWEYDTVLDKWSQKADFGGIKRTGAVGFAIGNKGYIGTGSNAYESDEYLKDFWEYDPVLDRWTQKANFSGGDRADGISFSIGCKGYVGFGENSNKKFKTDLWEYDPVKDLWIHKADLPSDGRDEAVGFSIGNRGYIGTGGEEFPWKKDFWEYTPDVEIPFVDGGLDVTILQGSSTTLKATGGISYLWFPNIKLNPDSGANVTASPDSTIEYYVTAINSVGCKNSDSVKVTVRANCGEVFVPNAFSPNNDGKNDTLFVKGNCLQNMVFEIFDRWGEKVFETKNLMEGWDGSYNERQLNQGIYAYQLRGIQNKTPIEQSGMINLVK